MHTIQETHTVSCTVKAEDLGKVKEALKTKQSVSKDIQVCTLTHFERFYKHDVTFANLSFNSHQL